MLKALSLSFSQKKRKERGDQIPLTEIKMETIELPYIKMLPMA